MAKNEKDSAPAPKEMTKKEKEAKIEELLADLKREKDPKEKRNIRARLRTLGHAGGLPKEKTEAKSSGGATKGKRAKAAA